MGLFDRLFGKKEEPKIEEVVKEALENLDLSEDVESALAENEGVPQEEAEVESSEAAVFEEEKIQVTVEESLDSELAVEVQQEEVAVEENLEFIEAEEENSFEVLEPEIPQAEETVQEKYDRSLKKTRTGFGARLNAFFATFRSVDEEFFEELEELLIMSDVGVQVASNLTEELRYEAKLENAKKPNALRRVIIEKLVELYEKDGNYDESIHFQDGLTVMLFVGVNGVGKTTSIGKLAHRYKQAGK
ncbi:signal recognition particle receptor subunit alpha, partial [uncultured Streptococcus sp.]|uniref:signal recognition particle receptor subunit alpha n=1 Tax=uncultured Streptococcus sp. TaxID=83427 RepID=UPI0025EC1EC0